MSETKDSIATEGRIAAHICTANDMHPYECQRKGKCEHCDRRKFEGHDPDFCWLCHDGPPPGESK